MTNRAALCAGLACCLAAAAAHADLSSASAAYAKHDFAAAFEQFLELAQLGHPVAQETLAVMYVNAEGVKRDNVLGYAWASLAKEHGGGEAANGIVTQLEPHMTEGARKRIAEIRAQFGQQALNARVFPVLDSKYPRTKCSIRKPVNPDDYYPPEAVRSEISGEVVLQAPIMPDGSTRNPRVVYGYPRGVFENAGLQIALGTSYTPRVEGGVPVRCTLTFRVKFILDRNGDHDELKEKMPGTRARAETGDPGAQFIYALMLGSGKETNPDHEPEITWYVRAAQGGVPAAQYFVGDALFYGTGVEPDRAKASFWYDKAASQGEVNAQLALANYLMRPDGTPADHARAVEWLGKALAAGSGDALLYLTAILAASPDAAQRDPQRALTLLGAAPKLDVRNPSFYEIRAAARAMLGHFKDAQADQKKALIYARRLGWDLKPLQERLDRYAANQSWTGELMVY